MSRTSGRAPSRGTRPRKPFGTRRLRRNDSEIREISAGGVPHPETNQAFLAVAQLVDHQARLLGVVDEDAHLRARDDHPHMKPSVRIRHGIDGPLVPLRLLRSQLLPRVGGLSDVLYGVAPSGRVFGSEIEWPEVDRIVRRSIDAVE